MKYMPTQENEINEEAEYAEVNLSELRQRAIEQMPGHRWKLKGVSILECESCPFRHTVMLDPKQIDKVLDQL